jgi:uncharacterized membrane protein
MAWLEVFEIQLDSIVSVAELTLETISVLCVLIGLVKTIRLAIALNRQHQRGFFPFNRIRLRFGMWLALALEFQLGADILRTTISPSFEELGSLTIIAIIRTFLNYFLNREMEDQLKLEREHERLASIQGSGNSS